MSEQKFKQVGTRPIRHDGIDKVTGRAAFGADFALPGMLHGAVLRSPHAHARIRSIDIGAAEAMEGVKAILTGSDLPDLDTVAPLDAPGHMDMRDIASVVLARDKVLYNGHAVAAVAATTLEIAREAASRIQVDYEVLKPVFDLDEAIEPGAPILHEHMRAKGMPPLPEGETNLAMRMVMQGGDVEQGFKDADVVVEREFKTPMVHQGYIEPHAVVARTNEDDQSVVWCCTQGPFAVRDMTAQILDLSHSKLKVIPSEIGGGFGGKTTVYLEPLAVALSRRAGRPVKMVMTRDEVFRASGPTSASRVVVKIGAKKDGTLTAGHAEINFDAGAFKGSPMGAACMCVFSPYQFPNFLIEGRDIVTNKPKVAAYRAPGSPMGALAVESVLDEISQKLEIDPIDLRLKNAAKEGDTAPYGPKYGPIGLVETLQEAKKHPHYSAPLGKNQGRGVACGFWFNVGLQSSATVSLNEDGTAIVRTGNPDIGGSRASMALMAAEELGIGVEQVIPVVGDTESVGYTDLTGGSRVTYATGMAVINAAKQVTDELRARAAKIWDAELDDVVWEEGRAVATNGSADGHEPLTISELAAKMGQTGGPINANASLEVPAAGPGFATHLCDVEVDKETGKVTVLRYTAIQDAGKAVHPSYVEGQMQGGAAQGIGWALNEEYIFNDDGEMENAGFLDYRMPVASDLPMIDTVIVEVPNPLHPYGVRGVGEVPIVPPLGTVANAVSHATGVRFCELPIAPPRVLATLADGD